MAVTNSDPNGNDHFYSEPGQSIKGNSAYYIAQRFIGRGGNGIVFLVTCTSGVNQGIQFALKVFYKISNAERRERFLNEISLYQKLSHPSLIKIYDEGIFKANNSEYPFAIIEYIPENMANKIHSKSTPVLRLIAIRWIYNITSGVAYLHSQPDPIIHRDIKPANILIGNQMAKLGDLGLAKAIMDNETDERLEFKQYAAMPHFYRTPELVAFAKDGNQKITVASDIFQLGSLLYEAMTGFNPQKPPKNNDITKPIELDVRNIHENGNNLNKLIRDMLKFNPYKRPTAQFVLNRLNIIHTEMSKEYLYTNGFPY